MCNSNKNDAEIPAVYADYRRHLVTSEQKAQEDFDKTVLSLSGGALGISFVFLKDIIGVNAITEPAFLFVAWLSWGFSTLAVLLSYFLSVLALRHAIIQVDQKKLNTERPGGKYAIFTAILNALGAIFFVIGVCSITYFSYSNLANKGAINASAKAPLSANTPAKTPSEAAAKPPCTTDTRRKN